MSKFIEYNNKSSVRKKRARLLQGGDTEIFENRLGWWERRTDLRDELTDTPFTIPLKYQHRPDIVAKLLLGSSDLDWLLLQYNDIVDVMEEFVAGRTIQIPSASRVNFAILSRPTVRSRIS